MISQLLVVISLSLVIGSWRPRSYMEPATDLAGGWGVIATIIGGGEGERGPTVHFHRERYYKRRHFAFTALQVPNKIP